MRFGLSSVCPLSFGSPFIGPRRRLPFFSFMSFCLHVSSSASFLSLARTIVRTLVCTHTCTRTLLTTVQVAQVCQVWFIGCPSSLGSSSSATTHTFFVCLVSFIFICLFCARMCLASFPGRMEATHASLRGGVCVCVCRPWNHRDPFGLFLLLFLRLAAGGARDHASLALTKTLALVCEIDLGRQIDVPAIYHFFEWREAKPRTSRHGIA